MHSHTWLVPLPGVSYLYMHGLVDQWWVDFILVILQEPQDLPARARCKRHRIRSRKQTACEHILSLGIDFQYESSQSFHTKALLSFLHFSSLIYVGTVVLFFKSKNWESFKSMIHW